MDAKSYREVSKDSVRYSKRINRPEQALQKGFVDFLELSQPVNCVWFAVPNGGQRSPIEAAIFKGLGVKAGVADLVLALPDKVAFLEFKSESGKLSQAQKEFQQECAGLDIHYGIATTIDEAVSFCRSVGVKFRLPTKVQ